MARRYHLFTTVGVTMTTEQTNRNRTAMNSEHLLCSTAYIIHADNALSAVGVMDELRH